MKKKKKTTRANDFNGFRCDSPMGILQDVDHLRVRTRPNWGISSSLITSKLVCLTRIQRNFSSFKLYLLVNFFILPLPLKSSASGAPSSSTFCPSMSGFILGGLSPDTDLPCRLQCCVFLLEAIVYRWQRYQKLFNSARTLQNQFRYRLARSHHWLQNNCIITVQQTFVFVFQFALCT